jgi:hypothetical protein
MISSPNNTLKPRRWLILWLFIAGVISQLCPIALSYFVAQSVSSGYGVAIVFFYLLITLVPIFSFATIAIIKPPHWLTLGLATAIAGVASTRIFFSSFSLEPLYVGLLAFGSGLIFVLARWINQRISAQRGQAQAMTLTLILVPFIWLAMNWAATTIASRILSASDRKQNLVEISSRLSALNFKTYMPTELPLGAKIISIVPAADSDVETLHAPRSLTFNLGQPSRNPDITLTELALPASFDPPKDCGPYDAGTLGVGPSSEPIPCQMFAQIGATTVYLDVPDYISPPTYNYYFRKNTTEFTLSTATKIPSDQMLKLVAGLAPISTSDLPKDLLQQY